MDEKPTCEELERQVSELEGSAEMYRKIVEASPAAVMAIRNGHFVYANPAGARLLGYSDPEEIVELDAFEHVAPSSRQLVAERIERLEKGETNPPAEIALVRKDGSKIIAESISVSILLQGKSTGVIIAKDITERKRVQERLRENEAKYRTLIEHAPDGIFIVDATTGQFLDCNQQGLKLFGYSREKMLSFIPVDFSPPVAPDGRPVPEVLQERLESLIPEKQIMFEWVHLHADGHEIPCEIRAVLLPSSDRPLLRASMIDITERKRTEEVLEKRQAFQELITRISTKFIGQTGDELKQAIQDALAEIGSYFEVDAVRLYRLSLQGDIIDMRNVWSSGPPASEEETAEMYKMKYPHLAAHYLQEKPIVYGCPDECPPLPDLRKILKHAKIKAGVGIPLEIDDSGVDVFALARTQSEHKWPKDILEYCRVIGQIILSAMRRREAEVELQDSYNEIKQLKDRLEQENIYLQQEVGLQHKHEEIVGRSESIAAVLQQAEGVAPTDTTVLILGETGTGKELMARAIHRLSHRKVRTMVKVNCAALPATLVESELFGREKGAFTGALTREVGRFEIADGSTIFLDEIGAMPLETQAKLLTVLQEGEFERLGSNKTIKVDVRVIAATNKDLRKAIQEGHFREDLYYRLNVFPIEVPPLHDRREDIPSLVWFFVKAYQGIMGKPIDAISRKDMESLKQYPWPGNVRELKNMVERSMILCQGSTLFIDLPRVSKSKTHTKLTLEEVERDHIMRVLRSTGWRVRGKNGAAEILGLKPTTLDSRIKKLGLPRKPGAYDMS